MKVFDAHITFRVADYFKSKLFLVDDYAFANEVIRSDFGLCSFFGLQKEYDLFKGNIFSAGLLTEEPERAEYGDFQTNLQLAQKVTFLLKESGFNPDYIIEPTCGKGTFILASLMTFSAIKRIIGVEIYSPYIWEAKLAIIDYYLDNPSIHKPEIEIFQFNVFDFDFCSLAEKFKNGSVLLIGNPPWVTNSMLGSLDSDNLPAKSNFKKHKGYDAITGKGNFDIAEYIFIQLIGSFQYNNGIFAFLVKNAVIKNLVFDQKRSGFRISNLKKYQIDSKKEFNVSVDASLFVCRLNQQSEFTCEELNLYGSSFSTREFGWVGNKFVSNIETYNQINNIDGESPFEWRQGIKHDLSSIMELDRIRADNGIGIYLNGDNQEVNLEEELIYGLLKSSDIKQPVIDTTRKFTIVTQRKSGTSTAFIEVHFPMVSNYLSSNKDRFENRKSAIYRNKPMYSIFGVGDYSFAPYKVAISALYKTLTFSLILPQNGKPIMLDDTCYLLGFDKMEYAIFTYILLSDEITNEFLKAVTFSDAKRIVTKEVLMRIDLYKLAIGKGYDYIEKRFTCLNLGQQSGISKNAWQTYLKQMKPVPESKQLALFQ